MQIRHRNFKRICLAGILLAVIYLVFSSRYQKYQIDVVVSDIKPEVVWEYVADFSKMRLLNPAILDFKIISDSGHVHDWRYTVLYTEKLLHWPYWLNTATADYIVTKSMPGIEPKQYAIKSSHRTCFFKGTFCLNADSEIKFSHLGSDTYCAESIHYQCLPFLSGACRRELEHQRKTVMHNLTTIFSKKKL